MLELWFIQPVLGSFRPCTSGTLAPTLILALHELLMIYNVTIDGTEHRLELNLAAGRWRCLLDGREVEMDAVLVHPDILSLVVEGRAFEIRRERVDGDSRIWVGYQLYTAEVRDPRSLRGRELRADHDKGARRLVAPMPGKVSASWLVRTRQ